RISSNNVRTIEFDRGELAIDDVRHEGKRLEFELPSRRVRVRLAKPAVRGTSAEFVISYHGEPKTGLQFVPERRQVYTIFSTSQWLVCVDEPSDKATLDLQLVLPAGLRAVGSGSLVSERPGPGNTVVHRWRQTRPVSTYLFGFAAGQFTEVT